MDKDPLLCAQLQDMFPSISSHVIDQDMLTLAEFLSDFFASLWFWLSHPTVLLLPVTLSSTWTVSLALTWLLTVSALFCWIMSLITNNFSQIDRFWSVLPPLYSLIITLLTPGGSLHPLLTFITVVWGSRLTLQFVWKGGYSLHGEDYRWAYVREVFGDNKVALQLFNLLFVSLYQSLLLLLLVAPQIALLGIPPTPLTPLDLAIAGVFLLLVAVETWADCQQQEFQRRKKAAIAAGGPLEEGEVRDGFVQSGLWAHCRHPNFLCEILLWWVFTLFPLSRVLKGGCGGVWWCVIGATCLTGIFVGSLDLTEQISGSKYPEYKRYQDTVPAYIPSVRMMTIKRKE